MMNDPKNPKGSTSAAGIDVLRPLSASEAQHEAHSLSQEQITLAVEQGRKELEAIQTASRYYAALGSKLRFA